MKKFMALRRNMKLNPCYFGPYKIIQKIGTVAYKLFLLSAVNIHSVFHVSLFKKKIGNNVVVSSTFPMR
jgi:hypothetical protein